MFLNEEALVLALEVDAPVDGELEFVAGCLEDVDGFGVAQAHELLGEHRLEAGDELFVVVLGEKLDVVAAVVEGVADAIFEEVLGEVHVLVDIDEGYFGLYHPELGQVAGGVGVFGTECGAEGIDGSEGCGSELAFELSADGEGCGFAEEVGGVVYFALLGEGQLGEGKRGDLEHGSGAFAVAGGDERGVEVVESALLEVAVDGEGEGGAHAEHGREGVGAWAQVGYLAEELE